MNKFVSLYRRYEHKIKNNAWSIYTTGAIVVGGTIAGYIFITYQKYTRSCCISLLANGVRSYTYTHLPKLHCLTCIYSWCCHMVKLTTSSIFVGTIVGLTWPISVPYILYLSTYIQN